MPDEQRVLAQALAGTGISIYSGTAKTMLPDLLLTVPVTRIIVSGLFGGLAPGINVADVCCASTIVNQGGVYYTCDAAWNWRAAAACSEARIGLGIQPWYSSGLEGQADTVAQRAALFKKTGATCIDDEARFAVAYAQEHGIPCNDFRSCSDDYSETLPAEARGNILDATGQPNLLYLAKTLKIRDIPQLTQIGIDYMRSLNALESAVRACASVFAT